MILSGISGALLAFFILFLPGTLHLDTTGKRIRGYLALTFIVVGIRTIIAVQLPSSGFSDASCLLSATLILLLMYLWISFIAPGCEHVVPRPWK